LEHGAGLALSTTHRERGELTPERWQQISRIFNKAISLDGEERTAFVADECGVDQSLRSEVEKLIAAHSNASAEQFIGGMAAEKAAPYLLDENDPEPPPKALNEGQQFGSYVILEALGAGGMGEVYLARDSRLGRTVALKVLTHEIFRDERRMKRFRQEAKVASSLNQPNILTVYEFGEVAGLTFLATEFIDGETLRDHLHERQLKLGEILDIGIQVLAALDAAHEARIVHRDMKPENVMIRHRDRVVKVLDFGLAKVTEKKSSKKDEASEAATAFKTAPGTIVGTINYLSPEQARGDAVDERTDIWSTGVMMYEMIAGTIPFTGATTSHTIVQILEKDPVPLSNLGDVPPELERIVEKAMAKSPDERYQTAKDMLIDLRSLKKRMDMEVEIRRTLPTTSVTPVATQEVAGPSKKRVLVVALIGMAIVTGAIFGVNKWRSSRARSVTPPIAPVATSERTLTYWITVQKFRGKKPFRDPFTIPGEMIFEEDYQIRLSFSSPQNGFLYILNEGPAATFAPEFNVVFPSPTANKGSSSISAGQVTQIPETSWLEFDAQQGTEKLWLVFAEDAVPELESLKEFASRQTQGLVTDPARNKVVQAFLKTHSEAQPVVEKGERLTTLKSRGKLLVYPIKLEHH
jgi:serine/threonine protein kinase